MIICVFLNDFGFNLLGRMWLKIRLLVAIHPRATDFSNHRHNDMRTYHFSNGGYNGDSSRGQWQYH
jgi:hypothetical protein